jgi:hypothetical protein
VPILVMRGGYTRRLAHIEPDYNATISMRDVTKSAEPLNVPADIANVMRRAFSRLRNIACKELGFFPASDADGAGVGEARQGGAPRLMRCQTLRA